MALRYVFAGFAVLAGFAAAGPARLRAAEGMGSGTVCGAPCLYARKR